MIDQQALGVRWLVNEFGPQAVPRVQWQVRTVWAVLCDAVLW